MIVREVLRDEKLVEDFDHFNDHQDTSNWLTAMMVDAAMADNAEEVTRIGKIKNRLDAEYDKWFVQRLVRDRRKYLRTATVV